METNPLFQPIITPVKPLNKKVLILIILSAVTFVLLLTSLLVTSLRRQPTIINNTKLTPTEIPIIPTIEVNKAIPTQYQLPLNQIDTEIKTQLEFAPPEIDQTIGQ